MNEREVYGDDNDVSEDRFKERYSDMPCAGTRVRRGRHWNYENQDDHGVGTVIGHSEEGVFAFFFISQILNKQFFD